MHTLELTDRELALLRSALRSFLEDFGHHPDPQIQDWVKATAKD